MQHFVVAVPKALAVNMEDQSSSLKSSNKSRAPTDKDPDDSKPVFSIPMTVSYTADVATCSKFGCFLKLLWRWRGSIYKIVWRDLLLFLILYYSTNLVYRHALSEQSQSTFESIVNYCATYSSLIPLSFVLGFYVLLVMTRWWEQYTLIPWPDSIAVFVSALVHGQDERGRLLRRTVMRYVCLCLTIVFTMISPCVKKRFPNRKHLVDAGLLLDNERIVLEAIDASFPQTPKHWMPIVWASSIITRARTEGRIRDEFSVKTIIDELNTFRSRAGTLIRYDFTNVPLVYTQVVTIAVYSFFICSILAHQWTKTKEDPFAIYEFSIPIFISMEFFFYMGWLKVAEILINPWGEDDDDFEVNWMIDRNLQVSYLIVDEMHHEHPELVKDQYWDEVYPAELPYDDDSKRQEHPLPSTAKYDTEYSPALSKTTTPSCMLTCCSQRFKRTFQRISHFSEDTLDTLGRSSDDTISDIESVKCITSYRNRFSSDESLKMKHENFKEETKLFTIPEVEAECDMENEYEGMKGINEGGEELEEQEELEDLEELEEEGLEYKTSSILEDNDSDSDPFERLRLERQKERIRRTNSFLQRYFGSHFKIATSQIKTESETPTNGSENSNMSYSGSHVTLRRSRSTQTHSIAANAGFPSQISSGGLDDVTTESTQAGILRDVSVSPMDSLESLPTPATSVVDDWDMVDVDKLHR